jgi:hypothetical protein
VQLFDNSFDPVEIAIRERVHVLRSPVVRACQYRVQLAADQVFDGSWTTFPPRLKHLYSKRHRTNPIDAQRVMHFGQAVDLVRRCVSAYVVCAGRVSENMIIEEIQASDRPIPRGIIRLLLYPDRSPSVVESYYAIALRITHLIGENRSASRSTASLSSSARPCPKKMLFN